jgi:hypothetical protein
MVQHYLSILAMVIGFLGTLYWGYDVFGRPSILKTLLFALTWGIMFSVGIVAIYLLVYFLGLPTEPSHFSLGAIIGIPLAFTGATVFFYKRPNLQQEIRVNKANSSIVIYVSASVLFIVLLIFGVTALVSLSAVLAIGNAILYGSSMVLVCLSLLLIPKWASWVEAVKDRQLGKLGAVMAFGSFLIQVGLELLK